MVNRENYNKYLFAKYQNLLLKVANNKFGRKFLRIDNEKLGDKKIEEIFANGQVFKTGKKNEYKAQFYTNQRSALRIAPLLEFFEIISLANYVRSIRYVGVGILFAILFSQALPIHYLFPLLSGTVDTFNPHATGSGSVNTGIISTWAGARSATTGTLLTNNVPVYTWRISSSQWIIIRAHLPFDTSAIDDLAVVSGSELQLYRDDSLDDETNTDGISIHVVPSTIVDPTSLATGDMDSFTFSSKGSIAYTSTTNNSYNNITVNIDQVNLSGYSKLGLMDDRDLNDNAPTGRNTLVFQGEEDGNPPIFEVTYTVPTTSTSTTTSTTTTSTSSSTSSSTSTTSTSSSTSSSTTTTSTSSSTSTTSTSTSSSTSTTSTSSSTSSSTSTTSTSSSTTTTSTSTSSSTSTTSTSSSTSTSTTSTSTTSTSTTLSVTTSTSITTSTSTTLSITTSTSTSTTSTSSSTTTSTSTTTTSTSSSTSTSTTSTSSSTSSSTTTTSTSSSTSSSTSTTSTSSSTSITTSTTLTLPYVFEVDDGGETNELRFTLDHGDN